MHQNILTEYFVTAVLFYHCAVDDKLFSKYNPFFIMNYKCSFSGNEIFFYDFLISCVERR